MTLMTLVNLWHKAPRQMTNAMTPSLTSATGLARLPALLAVCFGVAVVAFVGLSPLSAVHNAAHDARHAFAFPCH